MVNNNRTANNRRSMIVMNEQRRGLRALLPVFFDPAIFGRFSMDLWIFARRFFWA
jgi:hypothetical protein